MKKIMFVAAILGAMCFASCKTGMTAQKHNKKPMMNASKNKTLEMRATTCFAFGK